MRLLTDDPEVRPLSKFEEYSDSIAKLLKTQYNVSVGVFGDWGTGKTTLMKSIERKLTQNIIDWKYIGSSDKLKVLEYLERKHNIKWKEEELEIVQDQTFVSIKNNKEGREARFLKVSGSEENESKGKFHGILQTLKQVSKEILKENEIMSPYVTNTQRIALEIDGYKIDEFYGYIDSNDRLMIYLEDFKKECLVTCWFNPWKHELEEESISATLLKRIAFSIIDHPVFFNLKLTLIDLSKKFLGKLSEESIYKALGYVANDPKKLIENIRDDIYKLTFDFEKKSIYYDGRIILEKQLEHIRKYYSSCNIVVFIDDLDRCSPKTILELFESIKVVMDLEGFSYVLGLSENRIQEILVGEYEKIGLEKSQSLLLSSQYINKIIQITFKIQEYTSQALLDLVNYYLELMDDPEFSRQILNNVKLVVMSSRRNPRDLKRLLNYISLNYIGFSKSANLDLRETLFVIILFYSWNAIYMKLTSNEFFRAAFNNLLRLEGEEIVRIIDTTDNTAPKVDYLTGDFYNNFIAKTQNNITRLDKDSKEILASVPLEVWTYFANERKTIINISWEEFSPYFIRKETPIITSKSQAVEQTLSQIADKYFYSDKRYLSAARICDKIIGNNPNNSYAYNLKAMCLAELGEFEKSVEFYQKAFELEHNPEFVINQGLVYDQLSQIDPENKLEYLRKAIQSYNKVLEVGYDNMGMFRNIALDYYSLGEYEDALSFYKKVLAMDEKNLDALNGAGLVYLFGKKEYQKAIEEFKKILSSTTNPPWFAYANMAVAYENIYQYNGKVIQNITSAKECLKKALELDPDNVAVNTQLARLNQSFPF